MYSLKSLAGLMLALPLSAYTATQPVCPLPSVDSNYNLSIPCVEVAGKRWQANLEYSNDQWVLNQPPLAVACGRNFAVCAQTDGNLNLSLPVLFNGQQYTAELTYQATSDDFGWTFQNLTADSVRLKVGRPNPNGALSEVYLLQGDLTKSQALPLVSEVNFSAPQNSVGQQKVLRIFHFNDFHNELRSPHRTRGDTHRLSQMVKIVNEARANAAENEIVLFLSAGDDHIGNPLDELLGADADSFQTSPAYRAYSAAGLDMAVVGNHELDRGSKIFAKAVEEAAFPVLSANLYQSSQLDNIFPAAIGTAKGVRIGFVGLTTPQETLLRPSDDPKLDAGDVLVALENTLHFIEPYADVIVVLSHIGYNGAVEGIVRHQLEIGDVQVAETADAATDKPVIVVGGHTHTALNANGLEINIGNVPVVQTGGKGSQLGEAVMDLSYNGHYFEMQAVAKLHTIKRRDDRVAADDPSYNTYEHDGDYDQVFERYVVEPLYAMLAGRLTEVIGFAANIPELSTERTQADRYVGETLVANFMNDAIVAQSRYFPTGPNGESQAVDLAAFNASGVNAGVEPNTPITFNDWYGVMPFADIILITEMNGAQLKALVENNAKRIVRPEELQANGGIIDPSSYVSRGFLHFSSTLRYRIVLGGSAEQATAVDITYNGQPIENFAAQTFRIAFGDYIANGGEGWKGESIGAGLPESVIGFDLKSFEFNDTGLIYRNEILDYIRNQGEVSNASGALKDGRVTITP
jgi:2',3'-cyclic-nucleotide 2'-phosphodiesterase (5'-nucleotidase family)